MEGYICRVCSADTISVAQGMKPCVHWNGWMCLETSSSPTGKTLLLGILHHTSTLQVPMVVWHSSQASGYIRRGKIEGGRGLGRGRRKG